MQTSFQVGGAIGLAIVSAVVSGQSAGGDLFDAYHTAIAVTLGVATLGVVVAMAGLVRERSPRFATEAGD